MTFLMICVNKNLHDWLAAWEMRLICLTQIRCESASLDVAAEGSAVAGT